MGDKKQFEFSVIAGELKGKKIFAPDLGITRPPLTRLRKSIFDYLVPFLDRASYLDLFSGTGSYLFEAVSRGAARAVGVELEPRLAESITQQAKQYGVAKRLDCWCDDVYKAIPKLQKSRQNFDIIMMAPPQYKDFIDRALVSLSEHKLLAPNGQIICQHDTSETDKIKWTGFDLRQRRKYGNTTFTVLG